MLEINDKKNGNKVLKTKFGQISIDSAKIFFFNAGLVGLPTEKSYCVVDCPIEKLSANFKVLCAYENENLTFLVMPVNFREQNIYKLDEISPILHELNYNLDETSILLVASTKDTKDGKKITLNLRAPIFMDNSKQIANQCVLHNLEYAVDYVIE